MAPLLEVGELHVSFGGDVAALRGVNLSLERGESVAVIGESGAGKSTLAHCLAGLIQPPEASGSVRIRGRELLGAEPDALRAVRWATVALSLQGTPFNPVARVGDQIAEPLRERGGMRRAEAAARAARLAEEVLLDTALLDAFPHQLSGGQKRRAMLAMVLALDPELVVLDEPTAGLDPVVQRDLLHRIAELQRERGFGLVVISHDLPAATGLASRSIVLYAGEAMEEGATGDVIERPAHPYSAALLGAYPVMSTTKDLRPIRGSSPDPRAVPAGCAFHPRCTQAETVCRERHPVLEPARGRLVACHFGGLKTLLSASGLHKRFREGGRDVEALRGVSITVAEGEAVGVVGPSGSGKTTLVRILAGHLAADRGDLVLDGQSVAHSRRDDRRRTQLVAQDPWDALSPRLTVGQIVAEPLDVAGEGGREVRAALVAEMLGAVGLPSSGAFVASRAHELSGGQLQRVTMARALVARPKILIADEPTSMLDASEQARLLVILRELQVEMGLALVFVSHDLAVVRKVTDRVVILDAGLVVEEGSSARVCSSPASETGQRLVEAAPAFAPGDTPGDPVAAGEGAPG